MSLVDATLIPTKKNQPARDFLEEVAASYRREIEGGWRYEIPAEAAAAVAYRPEQPRARGAMAAETATRDSRRY